MKNKRICKTLSALCLTMVVAFGFTIPAFAQGSEQAPAAPAEDSTNDSNVIVEETEPAPALTPEGNAALVDDFGGNKQLITVTTKAGNYFYILTAGVSAGAWATWPVLQMQTVMTQSTPSGDMMICLSCRSIGRW